MEIYPNPICDNLTLQFPIQLLNQDINNKSVGISEISIDIKRIPKGMYYKIIQYENSKVARLVIL
jgi:hypothetical protein